MHQITLNIEKIVVLEQKSCVDTIYVQTDLPSQFPVEVSGGQSLCMKFEATKGSGIQYVRDNFGLEPEVLKGY